jgi:hypothetical protein
LERKILEENQLKNGISGENHTELILTRELITEENQELVLEEKKKQDTYTLQDTKKF